MVAAPAEMTHEEICERLGTYYAWKYVIGMIDKVWLPEARQVEEDFQRWYGETTRSAIHDLYSGVLIAIVRSRRHHLEAHLQDLHGRFIAKFGRSALPTS